MYVGTLYLSEMIQGANITLLVVIPISIIFGVFNVVSSLCKWNTGLLLSTLPLTLHLIVDIVLIGMYSQLLESIRLSDRSIYRDVYVLTLAYLCINISAQIILFALKDRLYKRIESSFSVRDPQGLLSWFWGRVRRHFRTYSGKTTSAAMRFCFLSCLLMIWDIAMWIAVFLQLISPGYLQGTFRKELGQEYDDDYFIGVLITLLVLELVYVILHILSVIVVILNKNKSFSKYVVWLLLAFILISDIVMTGLASDWLNKLTVNMLTVLFKLTVSMLNVLFKLTVSMLTVLFE
ncbi:uncharacterized protein LOC132554040 [Ylistrum balloti]|uniref:uncharacterized protein LOC132554040 n=1 Tax=Ylistrum balloti TaxID=509963 RepID=UPI002905E34B|nr:uncharacterized protein LOC132554040 [Ylistrum balloti]